MLNLNDLFDENYYVQQNPDVANAISQGNFVAGFNHFLGHGVFERRQPSAFYSEDYYLQQNQDVSVAVSQGNFPTGLDHFLSHGQFEGRDPIAEGPFTSQFGFGLVDAADAVARARGLSTAFPEVEDIFDSVNDESNDFYGLNAVNAPEVWAQGFTGKGVKIAVLDSGIDYNHPDLINKVNRDLGFDFVDGDNDPIFNPDDKKNDRGDRGRFEHGTHVTGIIAAERDSNDVTGVAYNAEIIPFRVLGTKVDGANPTVDETNAGIAQAIRRAVDAGADIINMSLALAGENQQVGLIPDLRVEEALQYAKEQGVVAVMAAGNKLSDGLTEYFYPARYAEQGLGIAVGALDEINAMINLSLPAASETPINFVSAPGSQILSTFPGQKEDVDSGTSQAAPFVTGTVALMLEANPNLTPYQVYAILRGTAKADGLKIREGQQNPTKEFDIATGSFKPFEPALA